jgi:Rod binding domain-containing protein
MDIAAANVAIAQQRIDAARHNAGLAATRSALTDQAGALDSLRKTQTDPVLRDQQLRAAAEEFSAVFLGQLTKAMRATVPQNQAMGSGSSAERMFQDLLDTEYARQLAVGSGYGLTDTVYKALSEKNRSASASSVLPTDLPAGTAAREGIGVEKTEDGRYHIRPVTADPLSDRKRMLKAGAGAISSSLDLEA